MTGRLEAIEADITTLAADAIVNPNQPGCGFESKAIAGVGVIFYVLLVSVCCIIFQNCSIIFHVVIVHCT